MKQYNRIMLGEGGLIFVLLTSIGQISTFRPSSFAEKNVSEKKNNTS